MEGHIGVYTDCGSIAGPLGYPSLAQRSDRYYRTVLW